MARQEHISLYVNSEQREGEAVPHETLLTEHGLAEEQQHEWQVRSG